jgi:hypothetical protein
MGRPASLNLKGMASSVWALDGAGTWDTANTAKILIDESLLRVHQDISIFALIDLFQASKTQVIDPHSRMTTTMLLSLGLGTIWLLDNIESLSRDKKSRQQLARSGILNTQSVGLVLLYMYVLMYRMGRQMALVYDYDVGDMNLQRSGRLAGYALMPRSNYFHIRTRIFKWPGLE